MTKWTIACMFFGLLLMGCPPDDDDDDDDDGDTAEQPGPDVVVPDTAISIQTCPAGCTQDGDPCTTSLCNPLEGCQSFLRGEFVHEALGVPMPVWSPRHMVFHDGLLYVADNNYPAVLALNPVTGQSLGRVQESLPGAGAWGLDLGPDGLLYFGAPLNGTVRSVDPATGEIGVFSGEDQNTAAEIRGLRFGDDGNLYVCSSWTDEVIQLDGATGDQLAVFVSSGSGGLDEPTDLRFGPDGDLYVVSYGSNEVLHYDGMTGAFIDVFVPAFSGGLFRPRALEFTGEAGGGYLLVSSTNPNEVLRYDGSTGAFVDVLVGSGGGSQFIRGLRISPWGDLFVSGSFSQDIRVFDASTGQLLDVLSAYAETPTFQEPGYPVQHDGTIYVGSQQSHAVFKLDAATGLFDSVFVEAEAGGLEYPTGMAFGPDGDLYVGAFYNGEVLRFDGETGAFDAVVATGLDSVRGIEFGPDGMLYAAAGPSSSWGVKQVDVETGSVVDFTEPTSSLSIARDLTFGADGYLYVASYASSKVLRFDGITGDFVDFAVTPGGGGGLSQPLGVSFGPDGLLYVTYQRAVIRFDPVSGDKVDAFIGPSSASYTGPSFITDGPGLFTEDGRFVVADQRLDKLLFFAPPLGPCVADPCASRSYCEAYAPNCLTLSTPGDGAPCSDGDPCTTDDVCLGGDCAGAAVDCDDQNLCTLDSCGEDSGCVNTPLADGDSCDDGDPCSENDACAGGVCSGAASSCDDGQPCTADSCDPSLGCVNAAAADGSPCTSPTCGSFGFCASGVCIASVGPLPDPCYDVLQVPAHQFEPLMGKIDSLQTIDLMDLEAGSVTVGTVPVVAAQPAAPTSGFFKGTGPVHGPTLVALGDAAEELSLTIQLADGTLLGGSPLPCPVAVHLLLLWDTGAGTIEGLLDADHALEIAALDSGGAVVTGPDGVPLIQLYTAPPGGPPPADVLLFAPPGLYLAGAAPDCGGVEAIRVRFPASASAVSRNLPFYHVMMNHL